MLNEKDFDNYQNIINKASNEAIKIANKYFRSSFNIDYKQDDSPVTIADKEIEAVIRDIIEQHCPNHQILGEEQEPKQTDSDFTWIIDPIDGTLSFMTGIPLFTIMICLMKNETPIMSLISQPFLNEKFFAHQGRGCFFNDNKINITTKKDLNNAILATCSSNYFSSAELIKFNNLKTKVKNSLYGGDAYLYMMLALNNIDIVIDSNLKPYDYLPLINIIEEAGGIITNWHGEKPSGTDNENIIATTSKQLHSEALRVLA